MAYIPVPPPLIYTCTDRWSCHCSGTKADDGVLNRLDKRWNLGVISQHQNLSHSYRSVLMLFSFTKVHLAFIFSCIYNVSAGFMLSLHLFLFCSLQNVLIWTNSVMRKWNLLRRIRTHALGLIICLPRDSCLYTVYMLPGAVVADTTDTTWPLGTRKLIVRLLKWMNVTITLRLITAFWCGLVRRATGAY